MRFSLMFFPVLSEYTTINKYELVLKASQYADIHGFDGVWTPERHFDPFGGIFPSPAITSTAIAMITKQIRIRAGSLVSPLHNPIRIVEDWSMIDNLSNGRVGISFASGWWNINDFIFYPEHYDNRRAIMYEQINKIQRLWEGEAFVEKNSRGEITELFVYPSPIQKQLPIWITSVGSKQTFLDAASIGANVLTHMVGQDVEELSEKITLYRAELMKHGFTPNERIVTVMLHTFINPNQDHVLSVAQKPLQKYIKASLIPYVKSDQIAFKNRNSLPLECSLYGDLVDIKADNCLNNSSLIGTPEKCNNFIEKLSQIGVNEVVCLIDFGLSVDEIMKGLVYLNDLKDNFD